MNGLLHRLAARAAGSASLLSSDARRLYGGAAPAWADFTEADLAMQGKAVQRGTAATTAITTAVMPAPAPPLLPPAGEPPPSAGRSASAEPAPLRPQSAPQAASSQRSGDAPLGRPSGMARFDSEQPEATQPGSTSATTVVTATPAQTPQPPAGGPNGVQSTRLQPPTTPQVAASQRSDDAPPPGALGTEPLDGKQPRAQALQTPVSAPNADAVASALSRGQPVFMRVETPPMTDAAQQAAARTAVHAAPAPTLSMASPSRDSDVLAPLVPMRIGPAPLLPLAIDGPAVAATRAPALSSALSPTLQRSPWPAAGAVLGAADEPAEVHIHIGRIDVTAVHEAPLPHRKPPAEQAPMSLHAYLAQRQRSRP